MSKRKKNHVAQKSAASELKIHNSSRQTCPAVSVIVPLYNVEKYVGECLDSLLAQTFQDFEVIVVDDCSTDNSVAVVESYLEKFGGRLILSHMKKNSGGAGFPRNKGIKLARGEYIYFCDPDDTVTPTALEELYSLAKEFDADVVQCEKWYEIPDKFWNDPEYRRNLKPRSYPAGEKIFITKPTLLTDNFEQRVKDFNKFWLAWSTWNQFIRRKFVVENEIKFENFPYSEDMVFTICEICSAKRYVVVPNVIYHYRKREGSETTKKMDASQLLHQRIESAKKGIAQLDYFLSSTEFYSNRSDLKYILFDVFLRQVFWDLNNLYSQVSAHAIDKFLRKEFAQNEDTPLIAFIFGKMNVQRLQLIQMQHKFNQFAAQAQEQVNRCNQFAAQAKSRIAELEGQVNSFKAKEVTAWQNTNESPKLSQVIPPPPPGYFFRQCRSSFRFIMRRNISASVSTAC